MIESLYVPDVLGGVTLVGLSRGLRSLRLGRRENIDHPGPLVREAERQLREYLSGERGQFDLSLDLVGTPFQIKVWRALEGIPYGETRSYRDIAVAVGKPKGAQAVGQANKRNPLLIIIPCHRVIAADGALGGWELGVDLKQRLLTLQQNHSYRFRRKQP